MYVRFIKLLTRNQTHCAFFSREPMVCRNEVCFLLCLWDSVVFLPVKASPVISYHQGWRLGWQSLLLASPPVSGSIALVY